MTRQKKAHDTFRRLGSSPEVSRLVAMMHDRDRLSLRKLEDLVFERAIDLCHETARL